MTKKVVGGELKKFKFELANDENFTNQETVTVDPSKATTDENGDETVPVKFATKDYELKDLENGSKTFTYYVREENESSTYPHYKFDQSVYRFNVVATDNTKGGIDCAVTYRKGHVNSEGKWINDDTTDHDLADTSTPTFTNTYSTSLPLSGMSGVTLTYLAGAAVLCAAAAWMHIRRKANAKEVSVVNKKVCSFPILFALLALLIGICAVVFPHPRRPRRVRPIHHGGRYRGAQLQRLPDL